VNARQRPNTRQQGFADYQRRKGRQADEVALEHAEIALSDRRDAIEDRDEQDALREDAGDRKSK
jgi:hypothetical protein